MKQFKTVFKFEYTNYVKSKSFIILTAILLLIVLVAGNIPFYKNVIDSFKSGETEIEQGIDAIADVDDDNDDAAAVDVSGKKKAAVCADETLYSKEVLTAFYGQYNWEHVESVEGIVEAMENGEYEMALYIDGLNYTVYQLGSNALFASMESTSFATMIQYVYQANELEKEGVTAERASEILSAYPIMTLENVGKDVSQSFWLGYVMLFLLYFTIILYGQYVSTSVVTEKTSKAMELLITSAKPMSLMFGKVIGTGMAGLTQFGIFSVSAVAVLKLNADGWNEINPMIGGIVEMSLSSGMFLYAVLFFMLGFFTFAFLYAAAASTVSRAEDAQSAVMLPMLLFIAAFFVAMIGMATPEAEFVKICSYVPFLSPMVMFMRICVADVGVLEILIGVVLSVVYLFAAGFVSTKIYRVGIMLYGSKPKIKDLLRYIKEA